MYELSESIYEEDMIIWTLISAENFNISYSDVMKMTKLERELAFHALSAIIRRRNKKRKS